MQLIVLGMHRSGTSMVTRLINLLGASLGPEEYIVGADANNPAGYFERADVFGINEELLRAAGRSWDQPEGFDPGAAPAEAWQLFKQRARAIVENLAPFGTWVMKDPRLCILFPLWRPLLEAPLCVVVHRNPVEVAQSLLSRDGIPMVRGLALWEMYMSAALEASGTVARIIVSYDDLVSSPTAAARRLFNQLVLCGVKSLEWPDVKSPAAFVNAKLRHHRALDQETDRILNDAQRELHARLREGASAVLTPSTRRP